MRSSGRIRDAWGHFEQFLFFLFVADGSRRPTATYRCRCFFIFLLFSPFCFFPFLLFHFVLGVRVTCGASLGAAQRKTFSPPGQPLFQTSTDFSFAICSIAPILTWGLLLLRCWGNGPLARRMGRETVERKLFPFREGGRPT